MRYFLGESASVPTTDDEATFAADGVVTDVCTDSFTADNMLPPISPIESEPREMAYTFRLQCLAGSFAPRMTDDNQTSWYTPADVIHYICQEEGRPLVVKLELADGKVSATKDNPF